MTSSVAGLRRSSKSFPKAKLAPKNVMITAGCSAVNLIHYRFLNSRETIPSEKYAQQIDDMHWKLQHLQFTVQQKGPSSSSWQRPTAWHTTHISKVEQMWPHLPYSCDLSPTSYHFFRHLDNFLQGKCFHNQQEAENAFQESLTFWSTDFYAIQINKLISRCQSCVDCNGSYFDK